MGFGRTGQQFACQHAGQSPDILCCAKGLTGGYLPLAATAVTEAVYQEFCGNPASGRILHHGHSFTGNPLGAAAACATLKTVIARSLPYSIDDTMAYFRAQLELFSDLECVGDIRSIGMVGALELVADRRTKEPFDPALRIPFNIARAALERGLIIRPLGSLIYFIPPLITTTEQIDRIFAVTRESIKAVVHA